MIIDSASGFLLIDGWHEIPMVLMINPFSGKRALLPYVVQNSSHIRWDYLGSVVVSNYGCSEGAVYSRPGDNSWSQIERLANHFIHKIVFKAGSFYMLDYLSPVFYVLDGKLLSLTRIIEVPYYFSKIGLMLMAPEEILLSRNVCTDENLKFVVRLFNLNSHLQESCWSKVYNLCNYELFCGYRSALYWDSKYQYLIEATGRTGLRNTIIQYTLNYMTDGDSFCEIYAYNLTDSTRKMIRKYSCSSSPFWILPNFDTD